LGDIAMKRRFFRYVAALVWLAALLFWLSPVRAATVCSWGNQRFEGRDFIGAQFQAIARGEYHSLALKSDGSIVGWGYDGYGQATPPDGNDYVAIAAGEYRSLALESDGSIVGWGDDGYGQARPPAGNDYVAIAAGGGHSLALKCDGSIVGWGKDYYGQATPPGGKDYVAIAAGWGHSLALKRVGPPMIEVGVKFTPQAVNAGSKGNWVKAHFVLPEEYAVEDVDAKRPAVVEPGNIESDYMNVFLNDDGLVEIEAAFGRGEFCSIVTGGEPMEVRVVGWLTSGQQFYGTDTIKITTNYLNYLGTLASYWLDQDCGEPDWCGGADFDQDSRVNFRDFALFDGCCIEVVRE
jgi:hypothetical protein